MATGEVRERDLARLRDVVAALHAPPGEATPNPEGPWGTAHDLLGITEGAVRTHLENACAALGVTNRLAAGAAAFDAAPPRGPAQRRETGP